MTDVGHKPGREKTARYIADNVPDPAPVKGATPIWTGTRSTTPCFNPRTREGCDHQEINDITFFVLVSIHAPVKGATYSATMANFLGNVSIHAPVKGATATFHGIADFFGGFNPRTREGCDDIFRLQPVSAVLVSIHAPVKGATTQLSARPGTG